MWLVVGSFLWTVPSQATALDPLGFTSLGTLNMIDSISINTDTLQLTGGASYTGVLDPVSGAGIFTFDDISGTRTLGLLSKGNLSFTGTINLLGAIEPIRLTEPTSIQPDQIILRDIGMSASNNVNITPGAEISGRRITLGSGVITLTGGTISGSTQFGVAALSATGEIVGTSGPTIVAPVPLPGALPLFTAGLGFVALAVQRRRARRKRGPRFRHELS
jgi:hypothetical protein